MSTSEPSEQGTEFAGWLASEYDARGSFTALIVLVRIEESTVTPLCSTTVNVIGSEVDWGELVVMFAGAGHDWDGVAFFPRQDANARPLSNPAARIALRELETELDEDRLVLNRGHFFDAWGRRMRIDEVTEQ